MPKNKVEELFVVLVKLLDDAKQTRALTEGLVKMGLSTQEDLDHINKEIAKIEDKLLQLSELRIRYKTNDK